VWEIRCACGGLWTAHAEAPRVPLPPTPLWPDPGDPDLVWKREDLNATGSFKDRGAVVLAEVARRAGAERLVADSSGSAGLAAAAAAARVAIPITLHVPANVPAVKRDALTTLGATLVAEGTREEAAERAAAERRGAFYFSHVFHPAFHAGTAEAAVETLAQGAPATTWVLPVGNGSLLLGLDRALNRLETDVRLIAVQSAAAAGLRLPRTRGGSAAAGINIGNPPRRAELIALLARRRGRILEFSETEIEAARASLGRRGIAAEAAAAAAEAGVRRLREEGLEGPMLAFLTGSGIRE
jgi:threonine synthase